MRTIRRLRMVVVATVVVLASIGGMSAYLLLQSTAASTSFIGRQYASLIPAPGQSSTFSAFVATKQGDELTLVSIKLLPLSGYRLPVLRHVKLLRASSLHRTGFLADYGWPIREPNGSLYDVVDLGSTSVQTGPPRKGGPGYPEIVYNIAGGPNSTMVADAGLAVTFRVNGSMETSDIDDGAIACFQNRIHGKPKLTYCTAARMNTVEEKIFKDG